MNTNVHPLQVIALIAKHNNNCGRDLENNIMSVNIEELSYITEDVKSLLFTLSNSAFLLASLIQGDNPIITKTDIMQLMRKNHLSRALKFKPSVSTSGYDDRYMEKTCLSRETAYNICNDSIKLIKQDNLKITAGALDLLISFADNYFIDINYISHVKQSFESFIGLPSPFIQKEKDVSPYIWYFLYKKGIFLREADLIDLSCKISFVVSSIVFTAFEFVERNQVEKYISKKHIELIVSLAQLALLPLELRIQEEEQDKTVILSRGFIASLLPKQYHISNEALDAISDIVTIMANDDRSINTYTNLLLTYFLYEKQSGIVDFSKTSEIKDSNFHISKETIFEEYSLSIPPKMLVEKDSRIINNEDPSEERFTLIESVENKMKKTKKFFEDVFDVDSERNAKQEEAYDVFHSRNEPNPYTPMKSKDIFNPISILKTNLEVVKR